MSDSATLRTPLHALHVELGARMAPFAGYDMPIQFPSGILAEHLHTRAHAGLFDVSHMGQAELVGPDHATVAAALERLCPADFLGLAPGRQRYSQLLNAEGGIVDDLMVARPPGADGRLYLVVNASRKAIDFALLEASLPASVRLTRSTTWRWSPCRARPPSPCSQRLAPSSGVAAMAFMSARPIRFGRFAAFVSRSGYTGEDGFEISLPADEAEAFARRLLADPDVAPIGLGARDSLRLEAGLCLYGHELDETIDPVEAGLAWSIQKRRRVEGGFPGAGAHPSGARRGPDAQARGPQAGRPRAGARRRGDRRRLGRRIGRVTSGGFGPASARRSLWAMSRVRPPRPERRCR